MTQKISERIKKFVHSYPSVKESMHKGLINFSALARAALKSSDTRDVNTGVVAAQRLQKRFKNGGYEAKARQLLRKTKIRVTSKISYINFRKGLSLNKLLDYQKSIKDNGGDFFLIEGQNHYTIIVNDIYSPKLKEIFSSFIIHSHQNLCLLALTFSPVIETTPGIVTYVYGLLAANGINIRLEMSCYNDLIMVIDKPLLNKALGILEFDLHEHQ